MENQIKKSQNLEEIMSEILKFREDRDWTQFHNPKDLAISLSLEASEVLEHFQWKTGEEIQNHVKAHKDAIAEELADVLYWVLLMSNDLQIDILDACHKKIVKNALKYPIQKSKSSHLKYDQLES